MPIPPVVVVSSTSGSAMTPPTVRRTARLVAAAASAVVGLAVVASAGCPTGDVWTVSTRRLPGVCGLPTHVEYDVERRIAGRWERADVAELLADSSLPLVVFIHGNRYEASEAKSQGVVVARQLEATCPTPVRTVVFSWPSQQRGRLIESSRDNYRRASADGHYLAWLLGRVPSSQPVAIIGYSLGGLIAAEALNDLVTRPEASTEGPWATRTGRTHLVLVAPAMRCDALAPRGAYAAATGGIRRLTLVINSRDLALRMFPHLDRQSDADALGVAGMSRRWLPAHVEFAATDAAAVVGLRHALPEYLESPGLMRRIASGAVAGLGGE
jgi:esterase/lipase superfamily enzyme